MADYVSKEELKKFFEGITITVSERPRAEAEAIIEVLRAVYNGVMKLSTTDAVEVIRCMDCKFSSPNQVYGCKIHSFADDLDKRMYAYDFCSMAERKEDD